MPFLWALAAVRLHPGLPVCWAALRCAGCLCCWGGGGWGRAGVWHTQVSREGGHRPLQVSVMETQLSLMCMPAPSPSFLLPDPEDERRK